MGQFGCVRPSGGWCPSGGLSIWGCVHLVGVVNVCVGPSEVTLGDGCACVCVHLGVRPSGGGVHLGGCHLGVCPFGGGVHLG